MSARICVAVLLGVSALLAQEQARTVTKMVPLKYANADNAWQLFKNMGITINVDRSTNAVVMMGPEDRVNAAETILKQLDTAPAPTKNIDLMAYMIVASTQEKAGQPVPKELDPVIKQIRSIFPYKSFSMLDTALLRIRDGQNGNTEGLLPVRGQGLPSGTYRVALGRINLGGGGAEGTVRLTDFQLQLKIPQAAGDKSAALWSYRDVNIHTDVDIKEGQKVVVGKANIDGTDDALIVVLTAKVAD